MISKYEDIETARKLIEHIMFHGLSTDQEDICRAQDIIGNSPACELIALANDIGRTNEKGEPDPEGTWNSGRKGTQSAFYMVLFTIWNWEEATRFWDQHTNPNRKRLEKDLQSEIKEHQDVKCRLADQVDANDHLQEKVRKLERENAILAAHNEHYKARIEQLERENAELREAACPKPEDGEALTAKIDELNGSIMALKAKLYDYMAGEKG